MEEWRNRCAETQTELERSQSEARVHASEVYTLRTQLEEAQEKMEGMKKENKLLSGEIFQNLR